MGSLGGTAQAQWQNSLQPAGEPSGQVMLVNSGKPVGVIQSPAQPTPPEAKAAADLQRWIREMTGATLEITTAKPAGSSIAIQTDRSLGDEG